MKILTSVIISIILTLILLIPNSIAVYYLQKTTGNYSTNTGYMAGLIICLIVWIFSCIIIITKDLIDNQTPFIILGIISYLVSIILSVVCIVKYS